ncbi:hypothetical protein HYPSUDRAFT_202744 [Hypholoma sublateritium FD-334 SS-4]|uniref:Uncharacterized protein n=1 Tax=Hypholoma sublateritium (strain FD-334 SS-4) TaxID=945553 RepID=A0A0D2L488_HYPSF|nr:hypothetical protein HYPSUDRAFT_202744 [Hypholoma sublateritium FD-334 SS-4]
MAEEVTFQPRHFKDFCGTKHQDYNNLKENSNMEKGHIPFPSNDAVSEGEMGGSSGSNSLDVELKISAPSSTESHATRSSSKLTSSDKLSALPTSPAPSPNASRIARTSNFAMGNVLGNMKRGYRRSLDSSTALPGRLGTDLAIHNNPYSQGTRSVLRDGNVSRSNEMHPTSFRSPGGLDTPSSGKETPRQRVSFDSDRPSVGQTFSRIISRRTDQVPSPPPQPSSSERAQQDYDSSSDFHHLSSPSPSKSRAASPLRMLHNWSSGFHRGRAASEERFVPVDPFKFRNKFPFRRMGTPTHDIEHGAERSASSAYDCDDLLPVRPVRRALADASHFVADTLPREVYLNFLLRLPAMYFSRVARIFEDADVSRPDIQRMISTAGGAGRSGAVAGIGVTAQASVAPAATLMHLPLPFPDEWTPPIVSPALIRFKHSWEAFIDSLLREWKTLNLVSALLASAILTIFQIPDAAGDPVTRTLALMSLVCALMSLSYGCIYIVRFGTMRSMFHASRWAEEARKTNTSIWWNVWVLLATPAVWMAWAMLLFITAVMSFVWRTGAADDPQTRAPLAAHAALASRIGISTVLVLGVVYFGMIVKTLRAYGAHTREWHGGTLPGQFSPRVGRRRGRRGSADGSEAADKLREVDTGLPQRRGRERERSASVHVRRREEDLEPTRRGRKEGKGHALKEMLGLQRASGVPAQREAEREDDIELALKGFADVDVQEIGANY